MTKKIVITETLRLYNPKFGDDKVCKCGHSYDRHFDSYEDMAAVGCKYCQCFDFEEAPPMPVDKTSTLPMHEQLNNYHQKLEDDYRKEVEKSLNVPGMNNHSHSFEDEMDNLGHKRLGAK